MDPDVRRRVTRLARRQHGVVTRAELLGLGVTQHAIDWWLTTHQLVSLFPGVYRLGGAPDSWRGRALAAQRRVATQLHRLAPTSAPPPAVAVGGDAAAHLHGLPGHARPPRLVLVAPRRSRAGGHVPIAVRPSLTPADVVTVDRIPVTSLAWSAVETTAGAPMQDRRDLLAHLIATGRVGPGQLLGAAHRADGLRGRDGVVATVTALGTAPDHVRSRAERMLADACVSRGLPAPRTNLRVTTSAGSCHELDLAWEDVRLDVEVDGPHHLMPDQRRRDRARDENLRDDRWEVARFPVAELDEDVAGVADRVHRLYVRRELSLQSGGTGVE